MKKIFLPLLALVGMVTGFTLTSCGGGGGGSSLTGDCYMMSGGSVGYYLQIGDKTPGSNTYSAQLLSGDRKVLVNLWMVGAEDNPNTFSVSTPSWDLRDKAGVVTILIGVDYSKVYDVKIGEGGIVCTINKNPNGKSCEIEWVVPKGSTYTMDDSEAKNFAEVKTIVDDKENIVSIKFEATHKGNLAY